MAILHLTSIALARGGVLFGAAVVEVQMARIVLSRESVSLIHHVELNRAGWWDKGLERLILSVLWLCGRPVAEGSLGRELRSAFHINVEPTILAARTKSMVSRGVLVGLPGGTLKIAEATSNVLEKEIRETEQNEERARRKFGLLVDQFCPSLVAGEQWKSFNEHLLLPLVREVGARTYELVSGSRLDIASTAQFGRFLDRHPPECRPGLRNAIVSFLDPGDDDVRSYVLRNLNAQLIVEAGNLDAGTIRALSRVTEHPPSFRIFVDTNFLFSFLELHENPSNEAARRLVELVRRLSGRLDCRFYVSPLTIDETKRVIRTHAELLDGLRLPPNLAEAALEVNLTGVAQKFIEFSRAVGKSVSASEYFQPFTSDLINTLRGKNVELFNERMDSFGTRPEIVDDIVKQMEFEKKRFPDRCKTYEQLKHDVVLWHVVQGKRPARVESPIEAKFWIVTVDYHFLGYDSFKRRNSGKNVPVCLHPSTLIQMLQFWSPRTKEFEEAVLGSLRWPFLLQEFDPEAERVTSRILATLARFENVSQLPTQTVTSILVNEALRQQMAATKDVEAEIELVRTALVEENERMSSQLAAKATEVEKLTVEVENRAKENSALALALDHEKAQVAVFEDRLKDAEESRNDLGQRLKELETFLSREKIERGEKSARRAFAVRWFLILGLLLPAATEAATLPLGPSVGLPRELAFFWSVVLLIWGIAVDRSAQRVESIRDWPLMTRLRKLRIWFFGIVGTVVVWHLCDLIGTTALHIAQYAGQLARGHGQ